MIHLRERRSSMLATLGLDVGAEWGPFIPVTMSNGVALDFAAVPKDSIVPNVAGVPIRKAFQLARPKVTMRDPGAKSLKDCCQDSPGQ